MTYKHYTIKEICEWYDKNVNTPLPQSLIEYMIDGKVITRLPNKRYSLSELNSFLLQKEDCEYIKDENNKYMVKENRIPLFEEYKEINPQKEELNKPKFTFTKLKGNKLKLLKNE